MSTRQTVTARVNRWLADHHQVIGLSEALACGLTGPQVRHLVDSGRWQRIYPGVFRPASASAGGRGTLRAAVLAGGPGAAVSHLSGAWLWGVHDQLPDRPTIPVPHDRAPKTAGLRIVRSRHPVRAVTRYGVPTT